MKHTNKNNSLLESGISQAVSLLKGGDVIGIPTETYYGLAADPDNDDAVSKIFTLKGRPENKPILILISKIEQLSLFASSIPDSYKPLISAYWPGPLTLIFPARKHVSSILTGGTNTIGIRLTPNQHALRLINAFGKPITATSANRSNQEAARTAHEVKEIFRDEIPLVLDGGISDGGVGSTVINLVNNRLCIERFGRIVLPGLESCG